KLNRFAVLLRIILLIPAAILASVLIVGWIILAFFSWLTVLTIDRLPKPLFGMTTAILRYTFRTQAYCTMLSSAYPRHLFGDDARMPPEPPMMAFSPGYPSPAYTPTP